MKEKGQTNEGWLQGGRRQNWEIPGYLRGGAWEGGV